MVRLLRARTRRRVLLAITVFPFRSVTVHTVSRLNRDWLGDNGFCDDGASFGWLAPSGYLTVATVFGFLLPHLTAQHIRRLPRLLTFLAGTCLGSGRPALCCLRWEFWVLFADLDLLLCVLYIYI
jgi:hypothetical protein